MVPVDEASDSLKESILTRILPDEKPVLRSFTPTMMGQIINVWYELVVYVKHDAWNAFGQGKRVKFPIQIVPKPDGGDDSLLASIEQFSHESWNPNTYRNLTMSQKNGTIKTKKHEDAARRYSIAVMLSPEEVENQMSCFVDGEEEEGDD